jgi:hypothetical protein
MERLQNPGPTVSLVPQQRTQCRPIQGVYGRSGKTDSTAPASAFVRLYSVLTKFSGESRG